MHALALLIAPLGTGSRREAGGAINRSDVPYRNDEEFGKHSAAQKGKDVRFEA